MTTAPVKTVAMLTAGGLAPCLSSAVGGLIERYTAVAPDVRIIAYRNGYAGLLTGDHVQLDKVNPGQWFAKKFAARLGADKALVQKNGYFSRSAPANDEDLALIRRCVDQAVESALAGVSGVIGEDEERGDELRAIEFERIKGGKKFDVGTGWFVELLGEIGQG